MNSITFPLPLLEGPEPGRECGVCTACCTALPIRELSKPARQACDHVRREGCGQYAVRPESCRSFFCAWMRGDLPRDEAYRPDQLGVLVDQFTVRGRDQLHTQCHELWPGACDTPRFQAWLNKTTIRLPVDLLHRDGSLSRFEPESSPDASPEAQG